MFVIFLRMKLLISLIEIKTIHEPIPANALIMEEPGSWFLVAKCVKHLWKSDILSKVQVEDLHLYLKCHYSIGAFHRFCWYYPSAFFHKWNIG